MSTESTTTDFWTVLDGVTERMTLQEFVRYARREGMYCCGFGCGSGACETCPCCCAGWCVSGTDGIPDPPKHDKDNDDLARWLSVASEHNAVAAALLARVLAEGDTVLTRQLATWDVAR